jgi:hypothetical protein
MLTLSQRVKAANSGILPSCRVQECGKPVVVVVSQRMPYCSHHRPCSKCAAESVRSDTNIAIEYAMPGTMVCEKHTITPMVKSANKV